ncbi:hypothetical protein ABZY05_05000 [Streptomyces canus]|uniref:hypothetical protein n=1 Tax=Streptomyces canus TaxID=58343 RepID=UPI0033BBBD2E
MMNQAAIAEIVDLAAQLGMDPARLVDVLKLGSASSAADLAPVSMIYIEATAHREERPVRP